MFTFGMFDDNMVKQGDNSTAKDLWRTLVWSLRAVYEGDWLSKDAMGVPYSPESVEGKRAGSHLAGGYLVVICLSVL